MKAMSDINFLDSYWNEAKRIAENIKDGLGVGVAGNEKIKPLSNNGKMFLVNFSSLKNTWSPREILSNQSGRSITLEALSNKIYTMILKGDSSNVKPMIESICNNTVKKLTYKGNKKEGGIFLGYGHFRWNYKAYTLNGVEIEYLKEYFKIAKNNKNGESRI